MTPVALTRQPLCLPRPALGPRPLPRDPGPGRARRGTQLPREPQEDLWSRSGDEGEGLVEMSKDWGREGSVASGGCPLFSLTRIPQSALIASGQKGYHLGELMPMPGLPTGGVIST